MLNKNWLNIVIGGLVLVILLLIIYFVSQNTEEVLPPKLVVVEQKLSVSKNNKLILLAYVENVTNYEIKWSSSNEGVASVSQNGMVSGNEYGTAVITATYTDNHGNVYTDTCIIDVIKGDSESLISDVSFFGEELVISQNNELKLFPIISPSDASYNDIKYSSSDNKVAMITDKGLLKAIGVGRTCITVVVDDKYTDEMYVNVTSKNGIMEYVTLPNKLNFKEENLSLGINDVLKLEYDYLPIESDTKYLSFNSSNPEVVSVVNGVITCKKEGEAIVTVTSLNGVSAKVKVTVKRKNVGVTGISLTATSTNLTVGDTLQLTYQVYPTEATNKSVTFKSSDESIATVSNTGLVTAKKKGTVIITVTSNNGKSRSVTFTIKAKASSGGGNSSSLTPGQSADSYVSDYVSDNSKCPICNSAAQTLIMTFKGERIGSDSTITMKKGDTITINITLPSCCGKPLLLTRTTADGEEDWRNYLTARSFPSVNRYDASTAVETDTYDWVIRADSFANGTVTLSQTAEFNSTLHHGLKAMVRVRIRITS